METALSTSVDETRGFEIVVSDDKLKAFVRFRDSSLHALPSLDEILAALDTARVEITDAVRERAQEVVAQCARAAAVEPDGAPAEQPEDLLVAEGQAAVEATDGKFELSSELRERLTRPTDEEQIDYFALNAIITVPAGAVVGRVQLPVDGNPGRDVHGNSLAPRKLKGSPVVLGAGLRLADGDEQAVVAELAGRITEAQQDVRLCEVLEVAGDVDFESGCVDSVVDVTVAGTVRSGFSVHTKRSLSVGHLIEAADVEVGEDVTARGGVIGQNGAGCVRAGGSVSASHFNEARVSAGGGVQFQKEILNSSVRAQGLLTGERGTIIGGEVYAREGIEVAVLGSTAQVRTLVAVGVHVDTLRHARQMQREVGKLQKSADHIRATLQPLLADMKRLQPAQRERVTEMLFHADEVELRVSDIDQEREQLLRAGSPEGQPYILVLKTLYPGVRIRIGPSEVHFSKALSGPVKIERRKLEHVTEILAVNQITGSVTVLPSTDVDLDAPVKDEERSEQENETHESIAGN